MAELWPFIQLLVKKWRLEGRTFSYLWTLLVGIDSERLRTYFRILHHSNGNFMVRIIYKKLFSRLNSYFYTMAVYTEACIESQFSGVCRLKGIFVLLILGQSYY